MLWQVKQFKGVVQKKPQIMAKASVTQANNGCLQLLGESFVPKISLQVRWLLAD